MLLHALTCMLMYSNQKFYSQQQMLVHIMSNILYRCKMPKAKIVNVNLISYASVDQIGQLHCLVNPTVLGSDKDDVSD